MSIETVGAMYAESVSRLIVAQEIAVQLEQQQAEGLQVIRALLREVAESAADRMGASMAFADALEYVAEMAEL